MLTFSKISGIIDLLNSLASKVSLHQEFITLLIKITGIAILTEFAVSICKDSGETAIANKVDMGGKVIMISMSIPIMAGLLETILKILPWYKWGNTNEKINYYYISFNSILSFK